MIKILSSGMYLPKDRLTNEALTELVDTTDEWIVSRTGIKNRYIAKNESTLDLAYQAALNMLDNNKEIDVNDIDLIIVASMSSDAKTPGIANLLQEKLAIDHAVMSFDINAACSGFVYALHIASNMLATNNFRKALVIGVEKMSSIMDYSDRNTCILFGDGASGVIIERDNSKITTFYSASTADTKMTLYVDKYLHMEGRKVYQFAVDIMPKAMQKVLDDANLTIDDIDIIIPHQANIRIIESVSKHFNIPMDKFMINISQYGNTSAASIPTALHEYLVKTGRKENQKALLVGFGAGFTWSACIIEI